MKGDPRYALGAEVYREVLREAAGSEIINMNHSTPYQPIVKKCYGVSRGDEAAGTTESYS